VVPGHASLPALALPGDLASAIVVGGEAIRVDGDAIESIATHHAQVRYIPITAEGRRSFSVTCLSSIYRMEKHGLKPPPGARKER
jgi:hypothetical protein